jgi:hypothetical protein
MQLTQVFRTVAGAFERNLKHGVTCSKRSASCDTQRVECSARAA